MQRMPAMRFLMALFVIASLAADAAVAWAALGIPGHNDPEIIHLLLVALVSGQVTLLAYWVAWGRRWLFVRGLTLLLAVAVGGQGLGWSLDRADSDLVPIWMILLSSTALAVVALSRLARYGGWRWQRPGFPEETVSGSGKPQFSLASLLVVLTLTAIGLGLFRTALENATPEVTFVRLWWDVLLISLALSVLGGTAQWMLLRSGAQFATMVYWLWAMPLAGVLLGWSEEVNPPEVVWKVCLLQAGCLAAMLLVLRMAGFRLVCGRGGQSVEEGRTS